MPRLLPEKLLATLQRDSLRPLDVGGDLAAESRRRIRIAAAIGALAYATFLSFELTGAVLSAALERRIDVAHDMLGVALCAGLLLLTLPRRVNDRVLFNAALVAQVLLCVLISVAVPWAAFVRTGHVPGITWVVPVVILFPLLVPAAPRTTLIVSVLCGLAVPAGPLLLSARGLVHVPAAEVIAATVTGAVAVGIAVVASNTVHAARREAAAARRAGGYELLERIAVGGMGEIWKAQHVMLARPAAIKLIRPESLRGPSEATEALTARFTREARVTAGLASPHTVDLFDFGVSAEGRFYFAMELLEGINAEHFVYQYGRISPARAVHWLMQTCHSLGEAHALGFVHRDIKPGNLMVCRYGREPDFIKVLDFGLTRPVRNEAVDLTRDGGRLGTPGYMAPEQVYGLEADASTDVYALGCVGYWLIAGRKPFEAATSGEMLKLHASAPPPRLSEILGGPAPQRLEALLLECLAKDPGGRPRNADTLHAALAHCLDEPPWTRTAAEAWWAERASG